MTTRDIYDSLSPLDYRYWDEEFSSYLSENAFTHYKLLVELALIKVLAQRGVCEKSVVAEVEKILPTITTSEVYAEEKRIHHDIRALVNCLRDQVSAEARPFIHMTATSYDIVDTANAVRFRDAVENVLLPKLQQLKATLISLTEREAETLQIGRTHGQHAIPITFGFAIASYVNRLGESIQHLAELNQKLVGKFSGACGAYNSSALFFADPEGFEKDVLRLLNLNPATHSTQIVPPEPMMRLLTEVVTALGILANLADDMRHLQRSEIGEVGEKFAAEQVGSSTMPQKRNPINFENVKSIWKIVVARLQTVFLDQISEHQRDLTNSASARTSGEIIAYAVSAVKRMNTAMSNLQVDKTNLARNLDNNLVLAEPLYLILAALGHPDAHEKVRQLTIQAQKDGRSLKDLVVNDQELLPYLLQMEDKQRHVLSGNAKYIGIAPKKARDVANKWK